MKGEKKSRHPPLDVKMKAKLAIKIKDGKLETKKVKVDKKKDD